MRYLIDGDELYVHEDNHDKYIGRITGMDFLEPAVMIWVMNNIGQERYVHINPSEVAISHIPVYSVA